MCYIKRQLKFFIKGKVLFKIFGGASCKLKNIRGVLHNFGRHKALWNSSNMSSQIQPIKKTQKIHLGSITMDDPQLDQRQTCCRANIIICEIYICKFHFQFTYVRSLASCHHGIKCNNKYNCCSWATFICYAVLRALQPLEIQWSQLKKKTQPKDTTKKMLCKWESSQAASRRTKQPQHPKPC